ncbi:MAG: PLP-dependent aminotransferase family protein [Candidatus Baltobacteraceae bacterium]
MPAIMPSGRLEIEHLVALVRARSSESAGAGPLYRSVALALARAIDDGRISHGTRLPAERRLADALACSRATIVAVYRLLEAEGRVVSRRGSGTYVVRDGAGRARRIELPVPGPGRAASGETLDLSNAGALELPAEFGATGLAIDLTRAASPRNGGGYQPGGLEALREALAARYRRAGLPTKAEQIVVTSGAQQSIVLAATLVEAGDVVMLESPSYRGAIDAFRERRVRLAALEDETLASRRSLAAACRNFAPRLLYVTPSFRNPTGTSLDEVARSGLAALADAGQTLILEDDALAELVFEGTPQASIALRASGDGVLSAGSFNKLYWPGLRVGWLRAGRRVAAILEQRKAVADLGTSQLSQLVALALLERHDEWSRLRSAQLRGRRDALCAALAAALPSWSFVPPQGGAYLWVRLPHGDARSYVPFAARVGVRLVAGATASLDERHASYLRLPLAIADAALARLIPALAAAWQTYEAAAPHLERPATIV